MKAIKEIVEYICEELEDAEEYAEKALYYKEAGDPKLAETLYTIAQQEVGHINMLHTQATRLISEFKAQGRQVPESMQAVWDWEHEKMIKWKAKITAMLGMYKG